MDSSQPSIVRFGIFELDLKAAELRKHGVRVKLHDKPFQLLVALLEHPGELVSRKELQERLWPGDTFVEFENGLNNAVSRLRETLGDSAESPSYIETIPRRGYRFVGAVEKLPESPEVSVSPSPSVPLPATIRPRWVPGVAWLAAAVLLVAAAVVAYRGLRPPPAPIDSVAVLPFTTASIGDAAQDEYLAFGMTEALIAELSQVRALKVISQTSVLQYKGARRPLPEIARELGVRAVVEGSVVREGEQIRITVQLIDASTDTHLWAQTYRREMSNVLVMQSEVAQAIAREVRVQLTPEEQAALAASGEVNPQAHEAYLKGRYFLGRAGEESWKRGRGYFEQAIALDPGHAPAFAGLADYYVLTDSLPGSIALEKSRSNARKALELEETLADAHVSLGFALYYLDWDWAAAEREFRRALELGPGNVSAHRWYALYLETMGRHDQAVEHLQRAVSLDPLSIGLHDTATNLWFLARGYDQAIEHARKILELDPNDPRGYEQLSVSLIQKGEYAQAIAELRKGLALTGKSRDPVFFTLLTVAHGRLGQSKEAAALLGELDTMAREGHVPPGFFAIIHGGLGQNERALVYLEKAYRQRDPYMVRIKVSPWFDALHTHPRFQKLLRQMKFPNREPSGGAACCL
ncbi:MAG TPA: winged helix-turn-helix domain-containing protein [Terriglobia bacterium]